MKCSICNKNVPFVEWFIYNYSHKKCLNKNKKVDNKVKKENIHSLLRVLSFIISILFVLDIGGIYPSFKMGLTSIALIEIVIGIVLFVLWMLLNNYIASKTYK
jgi:hypothetical protein